MLDKEHRRRFQTHRRSHAALGAGNSPVFLPEDFLKTEQSFFLWTTEMVDAYREEAVRRGKRPVNWNEYAEAVCALTQNPADAYLLAWDRFDRNLWQPKTGRPCWGFLDGKLGDELENLAIRGQRWSLLFHHVAPRYWFQQLLPINGQPPHETLWERFVTGRYPDQEPNPYWRLHVWTTLVALYRQCRVTPDLPWAPALQPIELQLPWHDPDPIVQNGARCFHIWISQ